MQCTCSAALGSALTRNSRRLNYRVQFVNQYPTSAVDRHALISSPFVEQGKPRSGPTRRSGSPSHPVGRTRIVGARLARGAVAASRCDGAYAPRRVVRPVVAPLGDGRIGPSDDVTTGAHARTDLALPPCGRGGS